MLIKEASWITMPGADSLTVPVFRRAFACRGPDPLRVDAHGKRRPV